VLFGESAGGSSVDYYAYAWPDDPIVSGLIVQSGTAMMSDLFKPAEDGGKSWHDLATKLGCGASGTSLLKCVQSKTIAQVQDAGPSPKGNGVAALVPAFAPTADEKTVFSDVYNRAKAGKFIRKVHSIGQRTKHLKLTCVFYSLCLSDLTRTNRVSSSI
jgi:carboxylesterase type B